MSARFNRGTSTNEGVRAYQDHEDMSQFYYFPGVIECLPDGNLIDFKVSYYGFGRPYCIKDLSTGEIKSVFGAAISGRILMDITETQRNNLIEKIKQDFPDISTPKLLPLHIRNVRVEPTLSKKTMNLGIDSDVNFPTTVDFGNTFNYSVGSGSATFAGFAAAQDNATKITTNPHFGINIYGEAEFRGEAWEATIEADLKKVYTYIRKVLRTSWKIGWFRIGGADLEKIITNIETEADVKIKFEAGSIDLETYGRQLFEFARDLFTAINKQIDNQEGMFKFEPNPTPSASGKTDKFGGLWSVLVNGNYTELRFSQSIQYKKTLSYVGNFLSPMPTSLTLAVICNDSSAHMFQEFGVTEPCLTNSKIEAFNKRLNAELVAKRERILRLQGQLESGAIKPRDYDDYLKIINSTSYTDQCIEYQEAPNVVLQKRVMEEFNKLSNV